MQRCGDRRCHNHHDPNETTDLVSLLVVNTNLKKESGGGLPGLVKSKSLFGQSTFFSQRSAAFRALPSPILKTGSCTGNLLQNVEKVLGPASTSKLQNAEKD
jgi:hypothetical protein